MKILLPFFLFVAATSFAQKENFSQIDNPCSAAPLFQENKGQVSGPDANQVQFVYSGAGLTVFLLKTGIAYQFTRMTSLPVIDPFNPSIYLQDINHAEAAFRNVHTETYRMDLNLVGADSTGRISADGQSADYINYYNHNTLNVHQYKKITYHDVYPKIDWVIYASATGIKYEFVVRPGGRPDDIKLKTSFVEHLRLNANGSLDFINRMGAITEQTPVSYQHDKAVSTAFKVENELITFRVSDFDRSETLVIDPEVVWATYYGGEAADYGTSSAVDSLGNVYLAGYTASAINIAAGGYQNTFNGPAGFFDACLIKFNAAGVRQWATYYGGGHFDFGWACAVDQLGNVYLAGYTHSNANIASAGGHQSVFGGGQNDAFLVKFNALGTRLWATYYGGSSSEFGKICTAVDPVGNVYLSGATFSSNNIAFGGFQEDYSGAPADAFLVKFSPAGVRQWGTYYGSDGSDEGRACAADASGNVYLAGRTYSTIDFAAGGHQNTYGGGPFDAFLVKFNAVGDRIWATYYGGNDAEIANSCKTDAFNNVYMAGWTSSAANIATQAHQGTLGGGQDGFLVKFNAAGQRQWATYYGGSDEDGFWSCALDTADNIYAAGMTKSLAGIASGGIQNALGGGQDAFLVKFNAAGARQWGGYYGGFGTEDISASCVVDYPGNIYLTGSTSGFSFGLGASGHQNFYGGGTYDAFVVKMVETCIPAVTISADETTICSGAEATFTALPVNGGPAPSYQWKINGMNVGTNAASFSSTTLADGDMVSCVLTSNAVCATAPAASSNTIEMTVNPVIAPLISISSDQGNHICAGTPIVFTAATVNGGTNPVYQWKKNGANVGTNTDSYTSFALTTGDVIQCLLSSNAACVITSNATSNAIAMTVTNVFTPAVVIASQQGNQICAGAAVTFLATPPNAGSYQWKKNGINAGGNSEAYTTSTLEDGDIITCVLTSNAFCASPPIVASNELVMSVDTIPAVPTITVSNDSLFSSSLYGNQWFLDENPIPGATAAYYVPDQSGSYQVQVTNNDCNAISALFPYTTTGLTNLHANAGYRLFPNPTEGTFVLLLTKTRQPGALVSIYNSWGQMVQQHPVTDNITAFNLSNEPAGVYFLRVQDLSKGSVNAGFTASIYKR